MTRLLLVVAAILLSAPAWAQPAPLTLSVTGPAVTVFQKSHDACDPSDIPDAPARAIRDASGQVQLYAPHFTNRRLRGPDLLHVRNDCLVVFQGGEKDDPAAFDDRAWITSLFTTDGKTIYAAIHNEFQGHRRPWLCPSGRYIDCWYNAVTAAVSTDGGLRFRRATGGSDLIAALPYRYDEVTGHHTGYFNPSNMVMKDGALFMMVFATDAKAQSPGNCLLRTDKITDIHAWRAWDGQGFGVSMVDPYAAAQPQAAHVCKPVGGVQLKWPVTSLVFHQRSGLFIALMMNGAHDGGVYYAASPDLLHWQGPAKLLPAEGEGGYQCGDAPPVAYPSLLDPQAPDRNFAITGDAPVLFLTRFNATNCKTSMDRDLIRIPLAIR